MLFSKSLFVLLVATIGPQWFSENKSNGLASACLSSSSPPPRQQSPKHEGRVLSIDDIPPQPNGPIKVGLYIEDKYYTLPVASYYRIEFHKDDSVSSSLFTNPFQSTKGPIIFNDQYARYD
ncbi:uncharacterized protein LOC126913059 [Spodoptera frugiperda]|uniref:Uncharacterized protein LOC126913059 n=1 Tax=Spodoptera frugiperda TaxID=7108 RepID=A0A9R0EEY4_SPOFR|nr:uncharacterized protein LOC126913059 [Spodoptera frugiperda]